MNENERVHLPFFGIGKLIPYMAPYKWPMMCMVTLGLMSTAVDVTIPLFQEYALSTFIGKGSLDTLSSFIMAYAGIYIEISVGSLVQLDFVRAVIHKLFKLGVASVHEHVRGSLYPLGNVAVPENMGLVWLALAPVKIQCAETSRLAETVVNGHHSVIARILTPFMPETARRAHICTFQIMKFRHAYHLAAIIP